MSWKAVKWAVETLGYVRLSSVQRLVLITLAYHHNDATRVCTPSTQTLCDETGLSRRAVQLAIQALQESGLITVTTRTLHGIQTSNQYDLYGRVKVRTTCTPGGASRAPGGAHETEQRGRTTCTQTYNSTLDVAENVTPFPSKRGAMQ